MTDNVINVTPLPRGLELDIFNRESHYKRTSKPSFHFGSNPKVRSLQTRPKDGTITLDCSCVYIVKGTVQPIHFIIKLKNVV